MIGNAFAPGPNSNTVRAAGGQVLAVPEGWVLLPPGDAALTRRAKAAGDHWVVQEKKGRKLFSRGIWAPAGLKFSACLPVDPAAMLLERRSAVAAGRAVCFPAISRRLVMGYWVELQLIDIGIKRQHGAHARQWGDLGWRC